MSKFTTGVSSSAFKVGTVIADDKNANITDRYKSEDPTSLPTIYTRVKPLITYHRIQTIIVYIFMIIIL